MPSPVGASMGRREWALLLSLSVLWGGSFFFQKVAVAELAPFTLVFGRVALAALALRIAVAAGGPRMPAGVRAWGALAVMGALNNLVPFSLLVWGQTRIPSGLASILNATTPIFSVVLAHALAHDEPLRAGRVAGVVLGALGVAVMIGPEALAAPRLDVLAQLGCLAAALSYALAGIFGRRFGGRPPLVAAAGQLVATSAMAMPLALLVDRPWMAPPPSARAVAAMVGLALLSTAVGYVVYFRLLAAAGATNALLVTLLMPATACSLGAAVLGERLRAHQLAGMAVIALGLGAIDGRPARQLRSALRATRRAPAS
jgi:drug/metabolite transporter (DMT)-like permease